MALDFVCSSTLDYLNQLSLVLGLRRATYLLTQVWIMDPTLHPLFTWCIVVATAALFVCMVVGCWVGDGNT